MDLLNKYQLNFSMLENCPIAETIGDNSILAHFLMGWDTPKNIVSDLIPLIDRGLKFGKKENWKTYSEISGLKEQMIARWESDPRISDVHEQWDSIKNWYGYYVDVEKVFLEGIEGGAAGFAFVDNTKTRISDSDLSLKDMELITNDFREIVILWLEFILRNKSF